MTDFSVVVSFYIPPTVLLKMVKMVNFVWEFYFSIPSSALGVTSLLILTILKLVVALCGSNLHFPYDLRWVSFCVVICHPCIFFGEASFQIFHPFKNTELSSICWALRRVCVFMDPSFINCILFFLMLRLRWQSMDRMGVVIFITSELHTFCLWFTWDSLEGIPLAMTHFPLWWCEHAESLKCSLPTYGEQVTRMNQGRTQ